MTSAVTDNNGMPSGQMMNDGKLMNGLQRAPPALSHATAVISFTGKITKSEHS